MTSGNESKYLPDTNVIIQAFEKCYNPDFTITFWKHLAQQSKSGTIRSIDRVRNEIDENNTFLANWAKNDFVHWEDTYANETLNMYKKLIDWSEKHPQFLPTAKSRFKDTDSADPRLVAHALATKCIVVTEEVYSRDTKKKIPIPNVCKEFDITYMNTFEMMRRLNIKLDYSILQDDL